jgi:hypothetical protein
LICLLRIIPSLFKNNLISKQRIVTLREKKEANKVLINRVKYNGIIVIVMLLISGGFFIPGLSFCMDEISSDQEADDKKLLPGWFSAISFSGLIEIEGVYEKTDHKDPAEPDEDYSDLVLSSVELGIDARIMSHLGAHLLFLWEENDTEEVEVDEAIVHIHGEGASCDSEPCSAAWYASMGRLYIPFGYDESALISGPMTTDIGEARETALILGLQNEWVNIYAGLFNGDVNERGKDDRIDNFFAGIQITISGENDADPDLVFGASYVNNISDSDELTAILDEDYGIDAIKDYVGGFNAFTRLTLMEKFIIEAGYLGATGRFSNADLGLDPGEKFKPRVWSLEIGVLLTEDIDVAVRCEGSDGTLDAFPDEQYGGVVNYAIFDNVFLAGEYLWGEFESKDKIKSGTIRLAMEF